MAEEQLDQVDDTSEQTDSQESGATETRARELGWMPKDEFRGQEGRWVDAKTWVDRGEQLLPIMKKQNQGLHNDLDNERRARQDLENRVRLQDAALKALENARLEDVKVSYEDARTALKGRIAEASRNGEHEQVAELVDELTNLKPPAPVDTTSTTSSSTSSAPAEVPEFTSWKSQNSWYGSDFRKSGLADGIGFELMKKGLRGTEFYRQLDVELAKELRPRRSNGGSRTEGAASTGSTRSESTGNRTYADLTREEKQACDGFISQVVGPKKKFKTANEWRAAYAAELPEE